MGRALFYFFHLKQWLRQIGFNKTYSKLKFLIRGRTKPKDLEYKSIGDIPFESFDSDQYVMVSSDSSEYSLLKPIIYDTLYSQPIPIKEVSVYKEKDGSRVFFCGWDFVKSYELS